MGPAKRKAMFAAGVLLLCCMLLQACAGGSEDLKKQYHSSALVLPQGFTITAHTGALHTRANTVHTLEKSIDAGVDIVEMDVAFRPDGTPVMKHASKPKAWQGTLLAKGLAAVAQDDLCQINLDLKADSNLTALDVLVQEHGLSERVFFTGVEKERVKTVQEQTDIPYYLNIAPETKKKNDAQYAQSLADTILHYEAIGINCHYTHMSQTIVDVLHENGLLVSVYTVNEKADLYRMLSFGVDNITTKQPTRLMNIIADWDAAQ